MNLKKKYALFIGRWQNWHRGHEWLVSQQLNKGKDVWIAVRDVNVGPSNPKTANEVVESIKKAQFIINNIDKIYISIVPDVESFNYGRTVGYDVLEHVPPDDIREISGTKIRNLQNKNAKGDKK
jgi:nicotinamide mononucleotide adenylyltransferase